MSTENTPFFHLGLKDIDGQHNQLLDYMTALSDGISKKDAQNTLIRILSFLKLYSETHFAYEEKLMAHHKYPAFAEHIALHREFNQRLTVIEGKINSGEPVMATEVLVYLRDWFINHIHVEDRKYAPYFILG